MPRPDKKIEFQVLSSKSLIKSIDKIILENYTRPNVSSTNWKFKYYFIIDYILTNQLKNNRPVNVSQNLTCEILQCKKKVIVEILKTLMDNKIINRVGGMEVRYENNLDPVEGKSFSYEIVDFKISKDNLERVMLKAQPGFLKDMQDERASIFLYDRNRQPKESLILYKDVLDSISIDRKIFENRVIKNIIENNQKDYENKINYSYLTNHTHSSIQSSTNYYSILLWCPFVPLCVNFKNEPLPKYELKSVKKNKGTKGPGSFGSLYTSKCDFVVRNIARDIIISKIDKPEAEQATRERIEYLINTINNKMQIPKRGGKSRVYTDITSADREMKECMLLDGKHIIGLDIRNSQPLIASLIFNEAYTKIRLKRPADVIQYQTDCENGTFYDFFMEKMNLPNDKGLRSQFKIDFFKKVFFSKNSSIENKLKTLFKERYPNVWKTVVEEKGTWDYSKQYKEFSVKLQKFEAKIIFDNVNVKLMNMGIKAFNIFDSIYVNSKENFEIAKKLTLEAFAEYGICPTINYECYTQECEEDMSSDFQVVLPVDEIYINDRILPILEPIISKEADTKQIQKQDENEALMEQKPFCKWTATEEQKRAEMNRQIALAFKELDGK